MATTRAEKVRNSAENDALAARLRREITGDVLFDPFSRGRYATDASFYQIMPAGVVVPRTMDEALRTLAIARDQDRTVTPRGGGTSQCGQTVNDGIVIDVSKHLNRIVSLDVANHSCVVEPGIVLDDLNRQLKQHGLWFPVDVSTASRATIGGMAGNNSCGGRSLRYGTMRDNTLSMDAALADGSMLHFGEVPRDFPRVNSTDGGFDLFSDMLALGVAKHRRSPRDSRRCSAASAATIWTPWCRQCAEQHGASPDRLGGYTRLHHPNRAQALAGDPHKVLGVCHFGSFYQAMDATQHLVKLRPIAVELVDRTMLALGREIAMFQPVIAKFDPWRSRTRC